MKPSDSDYGGFEIMKVNDLDKYTIKPDAIKDIITSKRHLIIL